MWWIHILLLLIVVITLRFPPTNRTAIQFSFGRDREWLFQASACLGVFAPFMLVGACICFSRCLYGVLAFWCVFAVRNAERDPFLICQHLHHCQCMSHILTVILLEAPRIAYEGTFNELTIRVVSFYRSFLSVHCWENLFADLAQVPPAHRHMCLTRVRGGYCTFQWVY